MKNFTLLIFFILSLLSKQISAQDTFAPIGAEWRYQGNNDHYVDWAGGTPNTTWLDHVVVIGDTTIKNTVCRQLEITRHYKNDLHGDSIVWSTVNHIFLYDNPDTVFVYNNIINGFTPLYLFSLNENDTVCIPVPSTNSPLDVNFCFAVDSIRMVNFDGLPLKTWYTRCLDSFEGKRVPSVNYGTLTIYSDIEPWVNVGRYTQKLGGTAPLRSALLPSYFVHNSDVPSPIPIPAGNLVCYQDPTTNIKLIDFDCDSISRPRQTGITSIQATKAIINIYPNPASEYIILEQAQTIPIGLTLQAIDITGRRYNLEKIEASSHKRKFKTEGLTPGVYFLKIHSNNNCYSHKIVIHN